MNRQDVGPSAPDRAPVDGPRDTCEAPVALLDRVTTVAIGMSTGESSREGPPPATPGRTGSTEGAPEALAPVQRYEVRDGRFCHVGLDRKRRKVITWLSNFAARIEEEITYDDGAELRREFRISGRLDTGEELPVARVSASELGALGWILREWGASAVVFAGHGARDHLRTALQTLSTPTRRRIYRHTGWIEHCGRPAFLYHGGAVIEPGIEVDLPAPLDRFRFPEHAYDPAEAVRCSLLLLDCGPPELTVPLLAAVYLAPLSSILNPDTAIWLYGRSGSMKSTLSSLAQCHFGSFDHKTLSASWTATDNALLDRLHTLKDVLSVIDDYAPQADSRAQSELDRRVQRVLRDVGNRAARSRLGGDLQQRPDHPPRGFLLCNGEMLPPGHSINARLVHVEVDRARLNLDAITTMQVNAERLPHAMHAYIGWVGRQLDVLKTTLPRARNALRNIFRREGLHLRQPEALANLHLAIDLFLRFAVESMAVSASQADEIRETSVAALKTLALRQAQSLGTSDSADVFVSTLAALLTEQYVRLADLSESIAPNDSDSIGWRRGDVALILPGATCRKVASSIEKSGGRCAFTSRQVHQDLVKRGYLLATPDGRNAGQWRVGRDRRKQRGWLLRLDTILPGRIPSAPRPVDPASNQDEVSSHVTLNVS